MCVIRSSVTGYKELTPLTLDWVLSVFWVQSVTLPINRFLIWIILSSGVWMAIQFLLCHFAGLCSRNLSVQPRIVVTNYQFCVIYCDSLNLISKRCHAVHISGCLSIGRFKDCCQIPGPVMHWWPRKSLAGCLAVHNRVQKNLRPLMAAA